MHRLRYSIGLLTLVVAIFAATWMVRMIRSLDDRPGLSVSIEFRNARGLRGGADVRYRGVSVGTVQRVSISADGKKAVAEILLEPIAAEHVSVNTDFWVVTPRFSGLTDGATGLDTLVRDSYIAFQTPIGLRVPLGEGSLMVGSERPPASEDSELLNDIKNGDLLMTLLVPENYALKPGSPVMFRGMQTGVVRSVGLSPSGTHVEMQLGILREYRQTVTDKSVFWVGRPSVSGALFSGFSVTDISALLSPYISYYGVPGEGVLVQDGYRASAEVERPDVEISAVPAKALKQDDKGQEVVTDDVKIVRISYAAIERDTMSRDDPILRQGSGLLFLDQAGRTIVITARSLVDGSYAESDFWGDPEIDNEQIKIQLPNGSVLRGGRVWVDPAGHDLAALVIEDMRPNVIGTPSSKMMFEGAAPDSQWMLRSAGPDGSELPTKPLSKDLVMSDDCRGGIAIAEDKVFGIYGLGHGGEGTAVVLLEKLPKELRPR
jgi:hypothetical protein